MAEAGTPQRKFVVFVSSVTTEFRELREKLWASIYKAGHIPVVLEKYPAAPADVREFIANEVADSDVFVFILGWEYGRGLQTDRESFIDEELQQAIRLQIPIIFLNAQYETTQGRPPQSAEQQKIDDLYRSLLDKAQRHATKLILFRPAKEKDTGYGELREDFTNALHDLTGSLRSGGWVPASWFERVSEQISLGSTVSQNPFFKRFVKRLDSFFVLSRRTERFRNEKEAIASIFWDAVLPRLPVCGVKRLFFESGSTIAYLSYEFIERAKKPWVRRWIADTDLAVVTNNILTYLDFVLADPYADPVECHLRPPAPADTYYGATFGRLTSLIELWPPTEPRPLTDDATQASGELSAQLNFGGDSLVLMTASGLDNSTDGFNGPHVGSYYNMLVKRVLLTSEAPAVLVLEQAKVFKAFNKGECFAVCDESGEHSWPRIRDDKPLAIVTCASKDRYQERKADLKALGFLSQQTEDVASDQADLDASDQPAMVTIFAANKRFAERFQLSLPSE